MENKSEEQKKEEYASKFFAMLDSVKKIIPQPGRATLVFKGQRAILGLLSRNQGGLLVKDIARELGFGSARAASALNELEKSGFIIRKTDESDKRRTLVELTSSGAEYANKMRKALMDMLYTFVSLYGEEAFDSFLLNVSRFESLSKAFCEKGGID